MQGPLLQPSCTTASQTRPGYPYQSPSSTTGRGGGQIFHNKSLIVNNYEKPLRTPLVSPTAEHTELSGDENLKIRRRGVARYGRGATAWISEDALRRKVERQKQFANTIQASQKQSVPQHNRSLGSRTSSSPSMGYVNVDGIPFKVTDGGSSLMRATGRRESYGDDPGHAQISTDTSTDARPTPKEAIVSGVTFKRSKNGNLIRAEPPHHGFVFWTTAASRLRLLMRLRQTVSPGRQDQTVQTVHFDRYPRLVPQHDTISRNRRRFHGSRKYCQRGALADIGWLTGRCPRGDKCFGIHDVHRIAICQSVLRGAECSAGADCDLTHKTSPQVAPTCMHFLRGSCTKSPCPYSHAPVDPSAPVCRAFAFQGYCESGSDCGERHLRECPDYSSGSGCRSEHCPLPHFDRASQMRRNAANKLGRPGDMDVDDISSEDEGDKDVESSDVDSDEIEEPEEFFQPRSSEQLQQQDFVGLN